MFRSFWHPSCLGHTLPIHPFLGKDQDQVVTCLRPNIVLGSPVGCDPSTRSVFVAVVVVRVFSLFGQSKQGGQQFTVRRIRGFSLYVFCFLLITFFLLVTGSTSFASSR